MRSSASPTRCAPPSSMRSMRISPGGLWRSWPVSVPRRCPGGRCATWAAGVVYALGQANFLFDPAREPCVTADQLSVAFGLAKSTMSGKAKQVRDLLRIYYFSPEFQRADMVADNPMIWMLQVNGLVMDARTVPLGIQVEAFQRGLIPYIPALGPDGTEALGGHG